MSTESSSEGELLWHQMNELYRQYLIDFAELDKTAQEFLKIDPNIKNTYLRNSLTVGIDNVGLFLHIARFLTIEDLKGFFPQLIYLAGEDEAYMECFRKLIVKLPKDWVLSQIEELAEPYLENGTYFEYSAYLGLYFRLDKDLAKRLAKRAIESSDSDIKEIGEEYMEALSTEPQI